MKKYLKTAEAIRALMARYVYLADSKDWDALADLFTPDGIFIPKNVTGEALSEMTGRENISTTIEASVQDATAIHHLFSYEVEVLSAEKASAIFAMEDYLIFPENATHSAEKGSKIPTFKTMHGFGHYHGTYVKFEDRWFISELVQTRLKLDFTY